MINCASGSAICRMSSTYSAVLVLISYYLQERTGITMPRRKGFTLIELLVVIAIIAILAAILFPVFLTAKAAANKSKCLNNAKQFAQACIMYEGDYDGGMVPGSHKAGNDAVWGDWYGYLNSYLRQMSKGSSDAGDFKLRGIYLCPSMPRSVYKSNGQEIPISLKRCYGLNAAYLGGDPLGGAIKYYKTSDLAKPTTTVRLLEVWNFREYEKATKGWGSAYCYPPVSKPTLCLPNVCWPPGWHNGSSVVGWCDGHVSWTTVPQPRPSGPTGTAADYKGVLQKYFRDNESAANADPWFRRDFPKP